MGRGPGQEPRAGHQLCRPQLGSSKARRVTGKLRLGAGSSPDIAANRQCCGSRSPVDTTVKGELLWQVQRALLKLPEKALLSGVLHLDFLEHCWHAAEFRAEKKAASLESNTSLT